MRSRLRLTLSILGITIALLISPPAIWAQPPVNGAIFTADTTCARVNGNLFAAKTDVFVNGGPQHPGSAGLPDGSYYIQVTDPSGANVLGTSVGSAIPEPVTVVNGAFTSCIRLWDAVFQGTVPGYADTPNAGGEYKIWVSNVLTFDNNVTKTDNFKVFSAPPPPGLITGLKFYDANVNGQLDSGETGIAGWQFTLWSQSDPGGFPPQTDTSDVNGLVSLFVATGTYGLCEVIPQAAPIWVPTTQTFFTGIIVPPSPPTFHFGNVCLGSGGGLTLGFWSNKNGQGLVTAGDLCGLNSLNLVNATGAAFDPVAGCPSPTSAAISTGKTNLRNWLLSATATNMANMLSAQYAAMFLNVQHGFVDPNAVVYAPGTGLSSPGGVPGFATITDVMAAAGNSLASFPKTTTAGPARSLQEALKNALDKANNNQNFVQGQACDVNYSVTEPSCISAP